MKDYRNQLDYCYSYGNNRMLSFSLRAMMILLLLCSIGFGVTAQGQAKNYKPAFGMAQHDGLQVDNLWVDGKEEPVWENKNGSLYLESKDKSGAFRAAWIGKGAEATGDKIEGNVVWRSAKGGYFAMRRSKNTGNVYRQNLSAE